MKPVTRPFRGADRLLAYLAHEDLRVTARTERDHVGCDQELSFLEVPSYLQNLLIIFRPVT